MKKTKTILARITLEDYTEFCQNCALKGKKPSEVIRGFVKQVNESVDGEDR